MSYHAEGTVGGRSGMLELSAFFTTHTEASTLKRHFKHCYRLKLKSLDVEGIIV